MKRVYLVVNMVENFEDENVTDLYTSVYSTYKRAKEEHRNLINEIEDNYNENGFSYNVEENSHRFPSVTWPIRAYTCRLRFYNQ